MSTPHTSLHPASGVRLTLSQDGARADVRLVRPEVRNAQTTSMWQALAEVPTLLPQATRVVVLSGEGASFSSGLDRRMIDGGGVPGEMSVLDVARKPVGEMGAWIAQAQAAFTWWRESPALTVAAVQGHAIGAGFQLALACDLVVCAEDAQFAMRETSLGLVPDLGGTGPLVHAVGYARALEICASGRWVAADEARALGLVVAVAGPDALMEAVDAVLAPILLAQPDAVSALKRLLLAADTRTREEQLQAERTEQLGRLSALASLLGAG